MRNYKQGRKARAQDSYASYLEHRAEWKKKGYALDEALSRKAFNELYAYARAAGMKNIVREFAKEDRTVTFSTARSMARQYNEFQAEKQRGGEFGPFAKKTARDFISEDFKVPGVGEIVKQTRKLKNGEIIEVEYTQTRRQAVYMYFKNLGKNMEVYGY